MSSVRSTCQGLSVFWLIVVHPVNVNVAIDSYRLWSIHKILGYHNSKESCWTSDACSVPWYPQTIRFKRQCV